MTLEYMDPQSEKAPGLHLPQPSVGEGVAFHAQYEDMPQKQETFNMSPEQSGSRPAVAPPVAAMPQPLPQTAPNATDDDAQAAQAHPATPADDSVADDLDKEWVNKAKMIVERTKE